MTVILIFVGLVLLATLAPRIGPDSRRHDDDAWSRDALWSRDLRPR
jgi:hypothetical protein